MASGGLDGTVDPAAVRECIAAQRCPWCDREGLRSLANHTVLVHEVYAHELRHLAGLPPGAPLCSRELSEQHRRRAVEQDTTQWLHMPEVYAAAAATRETNYDDEQRQRRIDQLAAARPKAIKAFRRSLEAETRDPGLAAARTIARSKAHRARHAGVECPICGAWFCSRIPPGQDYRQRKYCSDACRREAIRRLRTRTWMRRNLKDWSSPSVRSPDR